MLISSEIDLRPSASMYYLVPAIFLHLLDQSRPLPGLYLQMTLPGCDGMPSEAMDRAVHDLLAASRLGAELPDGELLTRFLRNRDEESLSLLIHRHSRMVWGVCRRLLSRHHDVEDAFQATFLVLVRKASQAPKHALAGWVYGVARQTAIRLRSNSAKRQQREVTSTSLPEPIAVKAGRDEELCHTLSEELHLLPEHYRLVLILCDLEEKTRKEVAGQLGIPEGSVASRLARGRELLAKRLRKKGVMISSTLSLLASTGVTTASPTLLANTIHYAQSLSTGSLGNLPSRVMLLFQGVTSTMLLQKFKTMALLTLLVMCLVGTTALTLQTVGMPWGQPFVNESIPMYTLEEKEPITAWGKETGGLQAGIGLLPGVKPSFHMGEVITLVLRVRNVSKEAVKFEYLRQYLDETPPVVMNLSTQKKIEQPRLSVLGMHGPLPIEIKPGETIELESRMSAARKPAKEGEPWNKYASQLRFELIAPDGIKNRKTEESWLLVEAGKISLHYDQVLGNTSSGWVKNDPALKDLGTGKLELEVKPNPPLALEKEKVLTPEEIFRDNKEGRIRLEFKVGAVSLQGSPFILEEATNRTPIPTKDGKTQVSRLQVILSEKVEAQLKQQGIEDLRKHFFGKVIRVSGNLKREVDTSGVGNALITYSLTIDSLEQIELRPLTPEEALKSSGGSTVTVEFNVEHVTQAIQVKASGDKAAPWVVGHGPEDLYLQPRQPAVLDRTKLKTRKCFVAILTEKANQELRQTGITDVQKHFQGKTIQVTGKLYHSSYDSFPGLDETALLIETTSQIQMIR